MWHINFRGILMSEISGRWTWMQGCLNQLINQLKIMFIVIWISLQYLSYILFWVRYFLGKFSMHILVFEMWDLAIVFYHSHRKGKSFLMGPIIFIGWGGGGCYAMGRVKLCNLTNLDVLFHFYKKLGFPPTRRRLN